MAHIIDDDESKFLAGIKMLTEGEMKEKLLETFLQNKHRDLDNTSKGNISKALFVDAYYEKNKKTKKKLFKETNNLQNQGL